MTSISHFYWDIFSTLNNARQMGVSAPNPISLSEIMSYCSLFLIVELQERKLIIRLMQALDREFLKYVSRTISRN